MKFSSRALILAFIFTAPTFAQVKPVTLPKPIPSNAKPIHVVPVQLPTLKPYVAPVLKAKIVVLPTFGAPPVAPKHNKADGQ